jgi:hypothetical protein
MTNRIISKSGEADGASAVGHILDTFVALTTAGANLLSIRNAGVEKLALDKDGNLTITGTLIGGSSPFKFVSKETDGSDAVAFEFNTQNELTGGKLLSIKNADIEQFAIYRDGYVALYSDLDIGTPAAAAGGNLVLTGLPTLGDTFEINGTTHTIVTSASGANQITRSIVDQVDQASLIARDFVLWSDEKDDFSVGWGDDRDFNGHVDFRYNTEGITGNSIIFTEDMDNCTAVDGGGFLVGGVDAVINGSFYNDGHLYVQRVDSTGGYLLTRVEIDDDYLTDGEVLIAVTDTTYPRIITISSVDIAKGTPTRAYQIIVKDESGGAGINKITIATEGDAKINGVDELDITNAYGSAVLYTNGSNLFTY